MGENNLNIYMYDKEALKANLTRNKLLKIIDKEVKQKKEFFPLKQNRRDSEEYTVQFKEFFNSSSHEVKLQDSVHCSSQRTKESSANSSRTNIFTSALPKVSVFVDAKKSRKEGMNYLKLYSNSLKRKKWVRSNQKAVFRTYVYNRSSTRMSQDMKMDCKKKYDDFLLK